MRILDNNHLLTLRGFDQVGHTNDVVQLEGQKLTAGKTWKGRLVSFMEAIGRFKDTCADFRRTEKARSDSAAMDFFGALKEKYGAHTADAALTTTRDRFKGMDVVRIARDIVPGDGNQSTKLTCGEVRSIIDAAEAIKTARELQLARMVSVGTQTDAPATREIEVQTEPVKGLEPLEDVLHPKKPEAKKHHGFFGHKKTESTETPAASGGATAAPVTTPKEAITQAVSNHHMVKEFATVEHLRTLTAGLGVEERKATEPRMEYVKSRVLAHVDSLPEGTKLSETEVKDLVKEAFAEAVKHGKTWNRAETAAIGLKKRVHGEAKATKADLKALGEAVKAQAKGTVTREYVAQIAGRENITLNSYQTKFAIGEIIDRAQRTARSQGIELSSADFEELTKIVAREVQGKNRMQLLTGF